MLIPKTTRRHGLFNSYLDTFIKTIDNFVSLISGKDEELLPDYPWSDRPFCDYLWERAIYLGELSRYYYDLILREYLPP